MLGIFAHLHNVSVHRSQLRQNWQSLNTKQSWTKAPGFRQKLPFFRSASPNSVKAGVFLDAKRRTRTASTGSGLTRGHRPVGVPAGISVGADRSHIPTELELPSAGEGTGSRAPAGGWRLAVGMMVMFVLGTCNFVLLLTLWKSNGLTD